MIHTIDRNPDLNARTEPTPSGCYIHLGQKLQRYARIAGVSFGIAYVVTKNKHGSKNKTVGLVIRESDRKRFEAQLAKPKMVQPGH